MNLLKKKLQSNLQNFQNSLRQKASESATRLPFDHRHNKPAIPIDKEDWIKGFLISVIIILIAGNALAAEYGYVVIKDKKGVCRVIKASKRTPSTIAGPFRTKEMAKTAMEKESPKAPVLRSLPARNHVQLSLLSLLSPPVRPSRRSVTRVASATGRFADDNANLLRMPASNNNAVKKTKMKIAPRITMGE
jgi:hypothetical protein